MGQSIPLLQWRYRNGSERTVREELSGILRAKYPLIFDVNPTVADDLDTVPTVFSLSGFECGDGWFDLIDMLCEAATCYKARRTALASALAVEKVEPVVRESTAVVRNARTGQFPVEVRSGRLRNLIQTHVTVACAIHVNRHLR
ncbi:hypothetical protein SAMN05445850_7624 [Paraburkholderia tuberum]|uniref:Uncharacterized protein n=1 Tax=Paraburkholderia tuberum TaxID=157910 RepID=A0A1H1KG62_9BURK|nr:hypothetical protein SAMN05445850_7624 [Paraburkholderia tuberum]